MAPLLAKHRRQRKAHAIPQFTGFMNFLCIFPVPCPRYLRWLAAGGQPAKAGSGWPNWAVGGLAGAASRLQQHQWKVYNYTKEAKWGW